MLIGQNWWCSLFPSLCFSDISNGHIDKKSENSLKKNLNQEEFDILTNSSPKFKIKFKIIEIFNN